MADHWVVHHPAGGWLVKRADDERIIQYHGELYSAMAAARPLLDASGGGELLVQDRHGRVRRGNEAEASAPRSRG